MQKKLVIVSLILVFLSGLILIPFISRNVSIELFSSLSVMFMFTAFLGVFDILKPVFVRDFSTLEVPIGKKIPARDSLRISLFWGGGGAFLVFFILILFFGNQIDYIDCLFLSLSVIFFSATTCFYATLESDNKVGLVQLIRSANTALFYVVALCLSLMGAEESFLYAMVFFLQQSAVFFLVMKIVSSRINLKKNGKSTHSLSAIYDTGLYNFFRGGVDYSDRILVANFAMVGVFPVYSLIGDLVSRINLPIQYYNAFKYPVLCKQNEDINQKKVNFLSFLKIVFIFYALIFLSAIMSVPLSDFAVLAYLGESYDDSGYIFSLLLILAALQVFNLSCVTLARSENRYKVMQISTRNHIVLSLIATFFLYGSFGYIGLLCSVFLIKCASLGIFCHYASRYIGGHTIFWSLLLSTTLSFSVGFVLGGGYVYMIVFLILLVLIAQQCFVFRKSN